MDELLQWRKEFPILESAVYMISHSLGAMPRRAAERMQEYAETWSARSIRAWEEGWWEMPRAVGDLVGGIIGAAPGEVVMQQNVSTCVATVLSCLDCAGRRNKIVSEALNFPSNLYQCHALEKVGARVATVASEDGVTVPLDGMLASIDDETRLVFVSHVLFKSSYIQDLAAIVRRAHEVGAMVLADIYQSAGTVAGGVRATGVGFRAGGLAQSLCGRPGAGDSYVRPE